MKPTHNVTRVVRAQPGDTLDALCWRHYERVDLLPEVLIANRHLAKLPALLPPGTEVRLPALADKPQAPLIRIWS